MLHSSTIQHIVVTPYLGAVMVEVEEVGGPLVEGPLVEGPLVAVLPAEAAPFLAVLLEGVLEVVGVPLLEAAEEGDHLPPQVGADPLTWMEGVAVDEACVGVGASSGEEGEGLGVQVVWVAVLPAVAVEEADLAAAEPLCHT